MLSNRYRHGTAPRWSVRYLRRAVPAAATLNAALLFVKIAGRRGDGCVPGWEHPSASAAPLVLADQRDQQRSHPGRDMSRTRRRGPVDVLRAILSVTQRLGRPVFPAGAALRAIRAYPGFVRDLIAYRRLGPDQSVRFRDLYPCLGDQTMRTPFDAHYLYQSVWATDWVARTRPAEHVDVASDVRFVTLLASHVRVIAVDIRPLDVSIANFRSTAGSITELPFEDRSVHSLSCLHVAEHIGLGRYGDRLDPSGTRRACTELTRVLASDGQLLFSVPVGRPRTMYNAHRIHRASDVPGWFVGLQPGGVSAR